MRNLVIFLKPKGGLTGIRRYCLNEINYNSLRAAFESSVFIVYAGDLLRGGLFCQRGVGNLDGRASRLSKVGWEPHLGRQPRIGAGNFYTHNSQGRRYRLGGIVLGRPQTQQ